MRRAIKKLKMCTLKLELYWKSALFSLACLWRAEASLSGLSLSTQHSTFIINLAESLPPPQLSQLQSGPCDCCLSHLTLHWFGFDVSINTKRAEDQVLIEQKGIMWLPASGGGTFFYFYICMFNSYFILLSGDFGPCFSQGLATLCSPITVTWSLILLLFHFAQACERSRLPPSTRGLLPPGLVAFSFLCSFHVENALINQQQPLYMQHWWFGVRSGCFWRRNVCIRGQFALKSNQEIKILQFDRRLFW